MSLVIATILGEGRHRASYVFRNMGRGWWGVWKEGTPTMHVVDTRAGRCDCSGFKYSKPDNKGCRHLTKAIQLEEQMSAINGTTEIAKSEQQNQIAQIITRGNLAALTEQERATYYLAVCQACDLNPATRPFEFINMKGKLVLYALKACTEQLRKRDNVNIEILKQEVIEGMYVVTVKATLPNGRSDSDLAAVVLGTTQGDDRANLIMKTITKAKRRVTLSICGLGMLDETEVEHYQPATAPATVQVVSQATSPADEERAQVEQQIIDLVKSLGIPNFESNLERAYGVGTLSRLSSAQIADLQGRLLAKQKAVAA